jgi:ATP-dependent Clp protease ATP-binding subunit ClpC
LRAEALDSARAALPPELWNRIDEPLYFFPLGENEVAAIAHRYIDRAAAVVRDQHGIHLDVDPSVIDALVAAGGFDPFLGARPMQRTVSRLIEAPLASAILGGDLHPGDTVRLSGKGTGVLISRPNSAAA